MTTGLTTDQILRKMVEKLHEGMDRFEARARGDRFTNYESIVEKHRGAVNEVFYGKDTGGINQRGARFRAEGKLR
jgi:hypothetical protein